MRVGRARDCDWALDDETLSRAHARFVLRSGSVLVRDLESARGTFMGAARLEPQKDAPWDSRSSLRIGRTVLTLRTPIALDEAVADVVEEHGIAEEPRPPAPEDTAETDAPPPRAEATAGAPVTAAPRAADKSAKPARSNMTPIVVGAVSLLILGCAFVLLWIFGVFART